MTTSIQTETVAGPFRASYGGPGLSDLTSLTLTGADNPTLASLGIIGTRGIRQIRRFEGEDFGGDLLGNSIIDSVYLGGQMFLEFELEEANKQNVMALMNPFTAGALGSTPTVDAGGRVGVPGTLATAKAGSLVLQPLYNVSGSLHTEAGSQTTPVRIYGLVTIAMGFDMEVLLASKRRTIPIRLRCYPYLNAAATPDEYIWYTRNAIGGTYLTE